MWLASSVYGRFSNRERNSKSGTLVGGAFHFYTATVGIHQVLDNVQPKSGAPRLFRAAVFGPVKAVKHPGLIFLGYSDPRVSNAQP